MDYILAPAVYMQLLILIIIIMNNYDENFNFYIILSEKNASIFILLKTRMKQEIFVYLFILLNFQIKAF